MKKSPPKPEQKIPFFVKSALLFSCVLGITLLFVAVSFFYSGGLTTVLLAKTNPFPCQDLKRLKTITLKREFSRSSRRVQKWENDIYIRVRGTPTKADLKTLAQVAQEINALQGQIKLHIQASSTPLEKDNIEMIFAPYKDFKKIDSRVRPRNKGYFIAEQDKSIIYTSKILIASTKVNQQERNHLIREELTQSLGLYYDTRDQPDSIFEAKWTTVQNYSAQDKRLIQLLYSPALKAGTHKQDFYKSFCSNYFSFECFLPQGPCTKANENKI